MTIHHVINDIELSNGGAQKIVRMLHKGLLERGVESRVVTLTGEVKDLPFCTNLALSHVRHPHAIFRLINYIQNNCNKDDVIHIHLFPANLFLSIAIRLISWKGKVVCTEHSTSNRRRGKLLGWCIDSVVYAPFKNIACISKGTMDSLSQWMPALRGRLVLVENGTELSFHSYAARPRVATPVVVSVGRLHPHKNLKTALQAFAVLKDLHFEYKIAGIGNDIDHLKRVTSDLGISEKVHFLGFVSDVPGLLTQADIFLMPSKWEGFGLAVVEAMNAGLPCVVSDVDGLRDVVTDECAFKAPSDRPDLFAIALRQLLVDPGLRHKMGERAHQRSLQFSSSRMVDNYLEFYKKF